MIIGIDVGGTHTDGVLLKDGAVAKTSKVLTDREHLEQSILPALDELLTGLNPAQIERIVFSTTLTTNLIAQKRYPPTGLVLIPGPGMPLEHLQLGAKNWILSGSIDHRGRDVAGLVATEIQQFVDELQESALYDLAIVGKFSPRNPALEIAVETVVREQVSQLDNLQTGHRVATGLNFPRRVYTTWLNTAVHREYANFLQNVEQAVRKRGLGAQLFLLKADGGTMPLADGLKQGVETIKSGPAASIMGFLALGSGETRPALLLDIGGSTTDLALMIDGVPLFEPEGVQVEGYLTAVRGLLNRSIPYGGDSPVVIVDGKVSLAPVRRDPALAFGGSTPTLTDALVIAGLLTLGDRTRVLEGFFTTPFAKSDNPVQQQLEIALEAIAVFYRLVETAQTELLQELNGRPVYTIHELLSDTAFEPAVVMAVGGPAEALLPGLAKELELEPFLPRYHQVANALGAALARPTLRQVLYADTTQRFYTLTGLAGKQQVSGRFTLADARRILWEHTRKLALATEANPLNADLTEITHEECFNIVRGFSTQGQIFKLEAQVKPGITPLARLARTP